MNVAIHLLYCVMPVLSADSTFSSSAESLKLYNSYLVTHLGGCLRLARRDVCDGCLGALDSEQARHAVRLEESNPQPQLQQVGHPQARTFCVPRVGCLDHPCQKKASSWLPTHHAMGLPAQDGAGIGRHCCHPLS